MRLSRAHIPLASEDRTHSQAISPSPHYNLAPHICPGFINLQHFCHSRWRNPVRLSKSSQGAEMRTIAEYSDPAELRQVMTNARRLGNDPVYWEAFSRLCLISGKDEPDSLVRDFKESQKR